jgi:hypothetical protein
VNETSTTNATTALHERTTASEAVVEAVADEEGVSPIDVRPPLYEVIDPDALDQLTSSMTRVSDESPGRIVFSYAGYEVTVAGDGEVSVAEDDSRNELTAGGTEDLKI